MQKTKPSAAQITIRLNPNQRALITDIAEKHELSESDIVRKALRVGLKKVDQALAAVEQ